MCLPLELISSSVLRLRALLILVSSLLHVGDCWVWTRLMALRRTPLITLRWTALVTLGRTPLITLRWTALVTVGRTTLIALRWAALVALWRSTSLVALRRTTLALIAVRCLVLTLAGASHVSRGWLSLVACGLKVALRLLSLIGALAGIAR
jgi:hypothetical protein